MKDNEGCLIGVLLFVIVGVIAVVAVRWRFNTIMAADIPDWVKYMLLK